MPQQHYYDAEVHAHDVAFRGGVSLLSKASNPVLRFRLWDFPPIDLVPGPAAAVETDDHLIRRVEFAAGKSWTFQMTSTDLDGLLPATITCYLLDRCGSSGRDSVLATTHMPMGSATDPRTDAPGGGPGVITCTRRSEFHDAVGQAVGRVDVALALRFVGDAPPGPRSQPQLPCRMGSGVAVAADGSVAFMRDAEGAFVPVRPPHGGDAAGRGPPWADHGAAELAPEVASRSPPAAKPGKYVLRVALRNRGGEEEKPIFRTGDAVRVRAGPRDRPKRGVVAYIADGEPFVCLDGEVTATSSWPYIERAGGRRKPGRKRRQYSSPAAATRAAVSSALLTGFDGGPKNPNIAAAVALCASLRGGPPLLENCFFFDDSADACRAATALLPGQNVVQLPPSQEAAASALQQYLSELLRAGTFGSPGLLCFDWGGALGVSVGWDSDRGWAYDLCGGEQTAALLRQLAQNGWTLAWVTEDPEEAVLGTYNAVARRRGVHFAVFAFSGAAHDLRVDFAAAKLRRQSASSEDGGQLLADALHAASNGPAPPTVAAPLAGILSQYRREAFAAFRARFAHGVEGFAPRSAQASAAVEWLLKPAPEAGPSTPHVAGSAAAAAAALGHGAPAVAGLRVAVCEPLQRAARRAESALAAAEALGAMPMGEAEAQQLLRVAAAADKVEKEMSELLLRLVPGSRPVRDFLSTARDPSSSAGPVFLGSEQLLQQPSIPDGDVGGVRVVEVKKKEKEEKGAKPADKKPAPKPAGKKGKEAEKGKGSGKEEAKADKDTAKEEKSKEQGKRSAAAATPADTMRCVVRALERLYGSVSEAMGQKGVAAEGPIQYEDFRSLMMKQWGVGGLNPVPVGEIEKKVSAAALKKLPATRVWKQTLAVHYPGVTQLAVRFVHDVEGRTTPRESEAKPVDGKPVHLPEVQRVESMNVSKSSEVAVCLCEYDVAAAGRSITVTSATVLREDFGSVCVDWFDERSCEDLFAALEKRGDGPGVRMPELRRALETPQSLEK